MAKKTKELRRLNFNIVGHFKGDAKKESRVSHLIITDILTNLTVMTYSIWQVAVNHEDRPGEGLLSTVVVATPAPSITDDAGKLKRKIAAPKTSIVHSNTVVYTNHKPPFKDEKVEAWAVMQNHSTAVDMLATDADRAAFSAGVK